MLTPAIGGGSPCSDACLVEQGLGLRSARVMRRAFVVGLSDEAGAGANVGLAAKARHAPTALEVARVDEYINHTLWGVKQDIPFDISLQDHTTMGIRASLFWVPTP